LCGIAIHSLCGEAKDFFKQAFTSFVFFCEHTGTLEEVALDFFDKRI